MALATKTMYFTSRLPGKGLSGSAEISLVKEIGAVVNLKTAFMDVLSNKCSNEIINMTQILAFTGGGGNGEKNKIFAPCLSKLCTQKETGLDASARTLHFQAERGCNPSASRVSAEFWMTAAI